MGLGPRDALPSDSARLGYQPRRDQRLTRAERTQPSLSAALPTACSHDDQPCPPGWREARLRCQLQSHLEGHADASAAQSRHCTPSRAAVGGLLAELQADGDMAASDRSAALAALMTFVTKPFVLAQLPHLQFRILSQIYKALVPAPVRSVARIVKANTTAILNDLKSFLATSPAAAYAPPPVARPPSHVNVGGRKVGGKTAIEWRQNEKPRHTVSSTVRESAVQSAEVRKDSGRARPG